MSRKHSALDVVPLAVARALGRDPYWFVIGGHAVRCFCPYRPSNDVDFGVVRAKDMAALIRRFEDKGRVEMLERSSDTAHLRFDDIDVSVFVLPNIAKATEENSLTAEGILATKLHAILDRGTRRDFFDLYVMMQTERFGLVDCLRAIRQVYDTEVSDGLFLRAITYFEEAQAEAPLPGEGTRDWKTVKAFFVAAAAALLIPPSKELDVQRRVVDVRTSKATKARKGR